jgi:hypothetical protein
MLYWLRIGQQAEQTGMEGEDQGHNSQQQSQLALIIREADSCKQETNTLPSLAVYFLC